MDKKNSSTIIHRLQLEITARVLFLYLYASRKYSKLSPQQFLHIQLNGGQLCVADIIAVLRRIAISDLLILQDWLLKSFRDKMSLIKQKFLVFAVDEASLAHQFLMGKFISPKSKLPRGLLTPLVQCLMSLPVSTLYAATNRSLGASVDDHRQKLTARFRAALRDIRESRLLESIYVGITFFYGNINFFSPLDHKDVDLRDWSCLTSIYSFRACSYHD